MTNKLQNIKKALEEALADLNELIELEKTLFKLNDEQWEEFCEALDRPPKSVEGLKKLFNEKGVFDEE